MHPQRMRITGIGWNHHRCMAPLLASARVYGNLNPTVEVEWATRSLADFGEGDLEALCTRYDLIVFDHPYVGAASRGGWLLDFCRLLPRAEVDMFKADSLGPCFESYENNGGLWGLPIDASAQMAAFRPDLLARVGEAAPCDMAELVRLARTLRRYGMWIALPSAPIDAICTFMTLCANLGSPLPREPTSFVPRTVVHHALELQAELLSLGHSQSLSLNPISCFERMVSTDEIAFVPLAFGYVSYACRPAQPRLQFRNIPSFGGRSSTGSILGGAGIGISSRCQSVEQAASYARFLASPAFQCAEYTRSGGQPASAAAWRSAVCDQLTCGFFSSTIDTLVGSYLRPTFDGFLAYFVTAGRQIHGFLNGRGRLTDTADWLERNFLCSGGE